MLRTTKLLVVQSGRGQGFSYPHRIRDAHLCGKEEDLMKWTSD